MNLTDNISANLSLWMESNPEMGTLEKVAKRADVGFGSVRRMKIKDGNFTITILEKVAGAFGRKAEDLLAPPTLALINHAQQNIAVYPSSLPSARDPLLNDLDALEPVIAESWKVKIKRQKLAIEEQQAKLEEIETDIRVAAFQARQLKEKSQTPIPKADDPPSEEVRTACN